MEETTMLSQDQVFEMVRKEITYAAGWAKGQKISLVAGVNEEDVHALPPLAGQPYSIADFMLFASMYWDEAGLSMVNFTPDGGATRIRLLKVIALLTRALQVHGRASDIERLAGVSCSKFPILKGGLQTFKDLTNDEGCFVPTSKTGALRSENPNCDPLKRDPSSDPGR
jgi:hypothetical protein